MDGSSFAAPLNSLSAFLDRENAEDEMPTPVCMDTGALRSGILKIPQDKRGFLVQTDSRSYYWRAQSQNEAEAWLLSIGTQCAAMKEMELLRQAEARIAAAQQQQSETCVRKVPKENKNK
ncbi:hypothetical protein, conserved [Eimeria necatrix]|uniref:PH domain-containing protein n=1 Tax=Eimeria necatrix TaxID=51315 RepID=U6MNF7_9EIME|nr:hypothetical protein, conserved [Eimeria necatrix]CDJ64593.1 hypothetical protein, conserved [Eimeria necatrix]